MRQRCRRRHQSRRHEQVLQVATGELVVGGDLDLAVANLLDGDGVAEVADTAVDLDLVLEELLEGGRVEDLVAGGLGGVDDELRVECKYSSGNSKEMDWMLTYLLRLLASLGGLLLHVGI